MDLGILGTIEFTPAFFFAVLSIVLIDIVLAGDNSVVIAMAVRSLPREKRLKGIMFGALAAVILRIIFTFGAARLMLTPLIKLTGGALILWIALKLMVDSHDKDLKSANAQSVWQAVWIILVADVTMSLDNVLAVAGASHGNLFLLIFGFALSIPLVVFTSTLISRLMDRYPLIMWLGAGILGKVGGEMISSDPWTVNYLLKPLGFSIIHAGSLHPAKWLVWAAEIAGVAGVLLMAMFLRKKKAVSDMEQAAA